jgi:hypothetical protein
MRKEEEGVMKAPAVERPASVRRAVNLMVAFVMIGWVVGCGGIHGADVKSQKRSKDISLKRSVLVIPCFPPLCRPSMKRSDPTVAGTLSHNGAEQISSSGGLQCPFSSLGVAKALSLLFFRWRTSV